MLYESRMSIIKAYYNMKLNNTDVTPNKWHLEATASKQQQNWLLSRCESYPSFVPQKWSRNLTKDLRIFSMVTISYSLINGSYRILLKSDHAMPLFKLSIQRNHWLRPKYEINVHLLYRKTDRTWWPITNLHKWNWSFFSFLSLFTLFPLFSKWECN